MLFFVKKIQKNLVMSKKCSTFAPAFDKKASKNGESVAQQVEHIPFKDGVLGSSPSWFTRKRVSTLFFVFCSPFSFFQIAPCNFACKITTKNPNVQDFLQNNRLNVVKKGIKYIFYLFFNRKISNFALPIEKTKHLNYLNL